MSVRILVGDARERLRTLPANSVYVCATSPPYLGLRDYGVEPSIWGGDPNCEHDWGDGAVPIAKGGQTDYGVTGLRRDGRTEDQRVKTAAKAKPRGQKPTALSWTCRHCGAWKGALGLEPTPELFIAHLVEVFDEVHRVLRNDGTCWVNIGDSYAGSGGGNTWREGSARADGELRGDGHSRRNRNGIGSIPGIKAKDLIGVPWMLAFALRQRGWWLRQEIIWHKPAPMPESTEDRCTKSHEHIFHLAKNETYYFDNEAIKEPAIYGPDSGRTSREKGAFDGKRGDADEPFRAIRATRNKRSVWTVPPEPYSEAHFATFPPALIEPCILAGSSERGACPHCGAGWLRITAPTERYTSILGRSTHDHVDDLGVGMMQNRGVNRQNAPRDVVIGKEVEMLGWYPQCKCYGIPALPKYPRPPRRAEDATDAEHEQALGPWRIACREVTEARRPLCEAAKELKTVPCVVLDPFGGSGTTAMVADRKGRDGIICELSPTYAEMARKRIDGDGGLFSKVTVEAEEPQKVAAE